MRSLAVINQKGGCGKTITAINLSAFLARERRKVLLVDFDPQGHATLGLQARRFQAGKTIGDVLLRGKNDTPRLRDAVRPVLPNLDLVPSDVMLSTVPEKLRSEPGRTELLAESLAEVQNRYHYAIVDCPPHIGLLTFNALMACGEAIIPIDPSFFSLHGIAKLLETMDALSIETGREVKAHALVTLNPGRSEFVKEVVEDIRSHMGDRVFGTVIRFSIKLAEAASHGLPITEYCRRCAGYEDYRMLAEEVMRQEAGLPQLEEIEATREISVIPGESFGGACTPSAPVPTVGGVIFTLAAPEAHRVQLAGDFNQWTPDGNEMELSSGVWRKMLQLAPGRYRYRYVVDGRWQADPLNSCVQPSPYGEYDSVLILDEGRVPSSGSGA